MSTEIAGRVDTVGQAAVLALVPERQFAIAVLTNSRPDGEDLHYAISTYMHRVVAFAGRRPGIGDLRDETVGLQDAFDAFNAQARAMATEYRACVETDASELDIAPRSAVGNQKGSA